MIIDCISDLHGHYPDLEGGDLLIVAGDLMQSERMAEWLKATVPKQSRANIDRIEVSIYLTMY